MGDVLIVGGTSGIGLELARHFVRRGRAVVLTGRRADGAAEAAAGLDGPIPARGIGLDLAEPGTLAAALADVGEVDRLALVAVERDQNTVADYDHERANRLTTLKLVGYTEVVRVLAPRLSADASVLLFGGAARERPYPGSTTVSIVNAGIVGMVATLAAELAPTRVNAIHPGAVADTPFWANGGALLDAIAQRTLTGRVPAMADVVDAAAFLLDNPAVNAVNLTVDGGWRA
ncbi:NAD(P)-dependent dehydrogenase (short-subunit alcohol dehydrogenase family) [Streptosporangium becharense]|uniref:NAD(P)-dependent dehydrogenase (Short-subunit alcohol dehydrogenase family) n=1 Tax=Streptosporangium becharense TaxID=1816182 RepID=A0A7W9MEC0_9ACTN|nr:SDR family oxidoreductase [Streptosporangium becharense]MBB2914142.1 NAD(P)-dependent dehydrogenase (short-subunit alcohol dehydrogenase family) [Streptosporangium becharense]MBB5817169.1 NAD(P)-dependent dehydrogenase (short-subunit alcohol dehydrogenase family) [Streptosporangium becharense]